MDSDISGDEDFLTWKLSAVDFESPAKLQSILGHEQHDDSSLADAGDDAMESCVDGHLEDSQGITLTPSNLVSEPTLQPDTLLSRSHLLQPLLRPDAEPKFHVLTTSSRREPQRLLADCVTSVEFSVPLTQFLYVPSISSNDFPSIQASFSDKDCKMTEAINPLHGYIATLYGKRLQVTCIVILKEWAYIAQQRRLVRSGVVDEKWQQQQRPSLRYNLVIGFARKLDRMFKIWVVHAAWMTSCRNIHLLSNKQILSSVFTSWKFAMIQTVNSARVQTELLCARAVSRSIHGALTTIKHCNDLTERDMRGYTSLLRRAVAVSSWLRVPVLFRDDTVTIIARAFFAWKDVLRDGKLMHLHNRIEQIESWLAAEPAVVANHGDLGRAKTAETSKFDRTGLESLSRDMLLSLGREEDDELQERIVMLLQIVTEVNQSTDGPQSSLGGNEFSTAQLGQMTSAQRSDD